MKIKTLLLSLFILTPTLAQYNSSHTGAEIDAGIRPYKVYTALMSQNGTDAPTAKVLENTLGGDIIWTRDSAGNYYGTLTGAFPVFKVYAIPGVLDWSDFPDGYYVQRFTNNTVNIQTYLGFVALDNLLSNTPIEIRVYP